MRNTGQLGDLSPLSAATGCRKYQIKGAFRIIQNPWGSVVVVVVAVVCLFVCLFGWLVFVLFCFSEGSLVLVGTLSQSA